MTLLMLFSVGFASAQNTLKGKVFGVNDKNEAVPLASAGVFWDGTNIGLNTNEDGTFSINRVKGYNKLTVAFVGYTSQIIEITDEIAKKGVTVTLQPEGIAIDGVTIEGTQKRGNFLDASAIGKKEMISFSGLCKMACCNLAESFENSAAVTVGYSDAISGARQIKMLGLAGVYTQMLDENRPIMRGMASPYSLSYTPGMWLQGIQVSKGISSVVNGHEALTGQINVEHRKPTDPEKLFLNVFLSQELRTEVNVATSQQINNKLSTVVLAHGSIDPQKFDHNKDGFMDMPTTKQINVANKWLYMTSNGMQFRAGIKGVYEERQSGQMNYKPSLHRGGTDVYGSEITNRNFNAYFKMGVPVGKSVYNEETDTEERSNVALILDYNYYDQSSYFGLKDYFGAQSSWLGNFFYQLNIDKRNKITMGTSATWDVYRERLTDKYTVGKTNDVYDTETTNWNFNRQEVIAGVFGEYTYSYRDVFNFIAGLRADHSNFHGWFYTPRAHVKWGITDRLTFRASGGLGYRSANFITDNIGVMATGRKIVFDRDLQRLEKGLTYGGSLTQTFRLGSDNEASLSVDVFRSELLNQIIVDQEYNSSEIRFYNLNGKSYTNTYQGDFNWTPFTGFDLMATFRWNDTKVTLNRSDDTFVDVEKPLVDRFKGVLNLQYATKFKRWTFDVTAQVNGQSRLPNQDGTVENFNYSPVYPMFFAQVTRKFKAIDVYLGCENIANFTQKNPILSANKPFDTAFNSSSVWGPLMGRKIYVGLRFNLY